MQGRVVDLNIEEDEDDFIEEEIDEDDGDFIEDDRKNNSKNFASKLGGSARPKRNVTRKNLMEVESDQDANIISEEEYI